MTRYHNFWQDGAVWFWTSTIVEWTPVLRSPRAAELLLSIWDVCRTKYDVKILGYVVMPEHFHILLWAPEAASVELFIAQSLRRFSTEITRMTARAVDDGNRVASAWLDLFRSLARGKSRVRVWKERGHGLPLTTDAAFMEKLQYIHDNPVRRGLCDGPEAYPFSSAAWYGDQTGPFAIDSLELQAIDSSTAASGRGKGSPEDSMVFVKLLALWLDRKLYCGAG